MIRAPFIIEGVVLGIIGAAIPLIAIYFLYNYALNYITTHFSLFSDVFSFIPVTKLMPSMTLAAVALGVGIGFIASVFALNKHLKV